MSDEDDGRIGGLIPSAAGEIVARSTSLVRRGLEFLELQKPTEDATTTQLRQRANAGDADAQLRLGFAYFNGRGMPRDAVQAARWFRKAAEHGHAVAQCSLGWAYAYGRGVSHDDAQARHWYRKAAEQGYAYAQYNLGVRYDRGVLPDYVEAYKWMNLAATRMLGADRKRCADGRDAVAKKMPPDQLSEARKRAREWTEAFEGLKS